MLEHRDLSVRYGRTPAVQGSRLEVGEGEIVGLVGPNGAGKSTTLAAIFGLRPGRRRARSPTGGESLVGLPTEKIVRRGIALVLEGRHIFATLTVAENLPLGKTANRDRAAADAALERVLDRFPVLRRTFGLARRHALRRRAAAAGDRPRAPRRSRGCCCSTSRRSAWRRCSSTRSSTPSPRSGDDGVDRAARRAERRAGRSSSPTAPTSSASGRIVALRHACRARRRASSTPRTSASRRARCRSPR